MAKKKRPFKPSRGAEATYARKLRQVAREVGRIVRHYETYTTERAAEISETLRRYAELITPWARETAARTAETLNTQNESLWRRNGAELGFELREQLRRAPVGEDLAQFQRENVELITSLPREAATRVQELTGKALSDSTRAREIQQDILRTGEVTKGRAMLIARTETAKASSQLTQTRAEAVGSDAYIWRTSHDGDVRAEHKRLEGKVINWDNPPVAGPKGMRYHAGQGPNCRCYPEPIIAQ